MERTRHFGLKKPGLDDPYNIQDQNVNMDILDAALDGDIDCGYFDEEGGALALHDASPRTHRLMEVDGNETEVTSTAETLEEHMADPLAHQNIIIDGNMD